MTKEIEPVTLAPSKNKYLTKEDLAIALSDRSKTPFRTPYDGNHLRVVQEFTQPSRTKQEFKEQCDINNIVQNFLRTGELPNAYDAAKAKFLNMADLPVSYHEALNLVIDATAAFDELPASARARYDNDVQKFLAAVHKDPDSVFIDPNSVSEPPKPKVDRTPTKTEEAPPASSKPQETPLQSDAS